MMYARYGGEHEIDRPFHLLRRAARYGRPLLGATMWAMVLTILATLARLGVPLILRTGIDSGVIAGDVGVILEATGVYLVILVLQYFTQRFSVYQVAAVGERYLREMRVRVFRHMMSLDIAFFSRSKVGVLVSRM